MEAALAYLGLQIFKSSISNWIGLDLVASVARGGFVVVQYLTFIVAYFLSVTSTVVIAIEAFALMLMIRLNFDIVNSPTVQIGFSIVLAFANLLLVAAVIAMAIATIVRYNPYGVKQLLFKIIIAAVGVNFSLVLAGTAVQFADELTLFFLENSLPGTSTNALSEAGKIAEFPLRLSGAFNPQRAFVFSNTQASSSQGVFATTWNVAAAQGGTLAAIVGVFLTLMTLANIVIFLGVLIVAFFMRYLWLGMLLVVSPAVWIAWVFPFAGSYVGKWMDKFLKWTFFGPLVLFFLYLGMKMSEVINGTHAINSGTILGPGGPAVQEYQRGINRIFSALLAPTLDNLIKAFMIGGTMWIGLYFASKFGISGAAWGRKAIESVQNGVTRAATKPFRYAGSKARQGATAAATAAKDAAVSTSKTYARQQLNRIRTAGKNSKGQPALQVAGAKMQELATKSKIARFAGAGWAGRKVANLSMIDEEVKKSQDEKIKEYKNEYRGQPAEQLIGELLRRGQGMYNEQLPLKNKEMEAALVGALNDQKKLAQLFKEIDKRKEAAKTPEEKGQIDKAAARIITDLNDIGEFKAISEASPKVWDYAPEELRPLKKGSDTERMSVPELKAQARLKAKDEVLEAVAGDSEAFGPTVDEGHKDFEIKDEQKELAAQANSDFIKKVADKNIGAIQNLDKTMKFLSDKLEENTKANEGLAEGDENRNKVWKELFAYKGFNDTPATKEEAKKLNEMIDTHLRATEATLKKNDKLLRGNSVNFETFREKREKHERKDEPKETETGTGPSTAPVTEPLKTIIPGAAEERKEPKFKKTY